MDAQPVFLPHRGRTAFLGRWVVGRPVGSTAFEKLPRVPPLGEAKDPGQRLDFLTAGKLIGMKPRLLFDAWAEARAALNEFVMVENRLMAAGFNHSALQGELWRQSGKDTLAVLRETAATAFDAHQDVAQARTRLGAEYGEPKDQDAAAVAAFDVALAQKYASAEPLGRAQMRDRTDPRVLAALTRAPRAISEITDAELAEMRERHIEVHFPYSAAAFEALEDCIDAPRRCVAEGLHIVGTSCGKKPAELVEGWGGAGEYFLNFVEK